MIFNEQVTQCVPIADQIPSQAVNATSVNSTGIDMSLAERVRYIIQFSNAGAGQANFQIQSSAQANFNVAHNMTGFSSANFNTNNSVVTAEVRGDQVQYQNPGDRYVRLRVTTNANITLSAIGEGACVPQGPGTQIPPSLNTNVLTPLVCNT